MEENMRKYHDYLAQNYQGGPERFFSPTGFLEKFQRTVEIRAQKTRSHVMVKTVDEAASKLEAAVADGKEVFDLTAEPGTGKTSVLPFRFPSKRVIVALPTPFDAWNAYNMSTGPCSLRLKGLQLGDVSANVTYTDSYYAAYALLSQYSSFDIMIVDECDSDRGVSKFLSEVKVPGKLLIRMSATHGKKQAGLSRAFRVTQSDDMPDVREGKTAVVEYIKTRCAGRSLYLAPDAATAKEVAAGLPDALLLTVETRLDYMARVMADQDGPGLYISDDTCGRALNLNLDNLFDSQLITEYGVMRHLTSAELYQRMNRIGRNREGWYYSPGLQTRDKRENDFDVVRHNVVRAIAKVEQEGERRLHVSEAEADELMCSAQEPLSEKLRANAMESAIVSSSSSSNRSSRSYGTAGSDRDNRSTRSDGASPSVKSVKPPPWLAYFSGYSSPAGEMAKSKISDTFIISNNRGEKAFERRKSSGNSSDSGSIRSLSSVMVGPFSSNYVGHRAGPALPTAEGAPYAVSRRDRPRHMERIAVPQSPPVMDLTQATYDIDWPMLLRDRLDKGGDLPQIVPSGSWRHTSAGGIGTDWFRRLDDLAYRDCAFDEVEFEVVVRAWNKLVAQAWVRRTPGLSNVSDTQRIEFCIRYFQSYFMMGTVG